MSIYAELLHEGIDHTVAAKLAAQHTELNSLADALELAGARKPIQLAIYLRNK